MSDTWGGAEAYEYLMGRWSRAVGPRFLEWARVPADGEVLDVGCGTGSLSEALLGRGTASVVGVDPSAAYVEFAVSRLARNGNVSFRVGDAMALPFPDGRFPAVVSSLMLNHVPDPARALREMRRVAKDGGVVACCVWDYSGGMEMLRTFWDAAVSLDPGAAAWDEGPRFAVCRPEGLAEAYRQAGLARVETAAVEIPMVFAGFDDYWRPFLGGQGPAGRYAMSLSEGGREALRDLLESRLRPRADGAIALTGRAWAARGVKG